MNPDVRITRIDTRSLQGRDPHPRRDIEGLTGRIVAGVDDPSPELAGQLYRVRVFLPLGHTADYVLASWELEPVS